jgi:DNA processing protein
MSKYSYWFSNIPGVSAGQIEFLRQEGICAQELYERSETQLEKLGGLTQKTIEKIISLKKTWNLEREWGEFLEKGIGFLSMEDSAYPQKLHTILGAPYALYFLGALPEEEKKTVAIVGARTRSAYGSQVATKLAEELAKAGVNVISGLARGIDADGHQGALRGGGSTYAVLGSGVDVCYPRTNRYLYEQMIERGGILSEYPPGTTPLPAYFPQRNRIISGLSDYVVVIEAREKSGSLITADFAMEQGREVYALPGRITDSLSQGCNALIQQGAGILTSVEDFLCELHLDIGNLNVQMDFRKNLLEKDELLVYALLDFYPVGLGTMVEKSPYGLSEVLAILERLEHKGFVRETIPNFYVRTI